MDTPKGDCSGGLHGSVLITVIFTLFMNNHNIPDPVPYPWTSKPHGPVNLAVSCPHHFYVRRESGCRSWECTAGSGLCRSGLHAIPARIEYYWSMSDSVRQVLYSVMAILLVSVSAPVGTPRVPAP